MLFKHDLLISVNYVSFCIYKVASIRADSAVLIVQMTVWEWEENRLTIRVSLELCHNLLHIKF